jgi:hypothetical protein
VRSHHGSSLFRQVVLALLSLFLLLFPFCSQSLTPQLTLNVINGNAPYLTFDGGLTHASGPTDLLWITLPNGVRVAPRSNPSGPLNPIELEDTNVRFTDIGMLVPTNSNSIELSKLIGPPNNYWGDDDGDGQGDDGISVVGSLNLSIFDRYGNAIMRSSELDACRSPYKVILSNTAGTLSTRYGFPNSSNFDASSAIYYIKPKTLPTVCSARPDIYYGSGDYAGPSYIWHPSSGFLTQSTTPSHYDLNFPTTGADKLYFYLEVVGVDPSSLSWPSVTRGGITASMEIVQPNPSAIQTFDQPGGLRVTLTGPALNDAGSRPLPSLPATFELVGLNRHGRRVVTYGFVLKQWFVIQSIHSSNYSQSSSWCTGLGYQIPRVRDLTNAVRIGVDPISGAAPSSSKNAYQRYIGAGFFSEWSALSNYTGANIRNFRSYWTSDTSRGFHFAVAPNYGQIFTDNNTHFSICSSHLRP